MPDYKELLDFEIKKRIRKIIKRYHKNEYVETNYLDNEIKNRIKNDLISELSLNEIQAKALVDGEIKNNIRSNLLYLEGLGFKRDHFAILSYCKAIKRLFLVNYLLPISLLFLPIIIIFFTISLINYQIEFIILTITFLLVYLIIIFLLFYKYKYIFIKENDLQNDILSEDIVKIYRYKYLFTPNMSFKDSILLSRYCTDICLIILYCVDEIGNKKKMLYIPSDLDLGYYEYKKIRLMNKYFKSLNKKINVKYYQKARFLVFSGVNFEKQIKRFFDRNIT